MPQHPSISQSWALITGASSGFGMDFARLLAARGYSLVLVARSQEAMQALAADIRENYPVDVLVVPMDLARPGVGEQLKTYLDTQGIGPEVLINNAGYGLFGEFLEQPLANTLNMLQLDIATVTELTHVFGNAMAARKRGYILQVASIGAYQATPTYAAYSAAKSYVLLFGEALHEELKKYGVTVTVISPGITATGFLAASGQRATTYQRAVMMQSREVAEIGLKALFAGRASIVPGFLNTLTAWATRLMPRIVQRKLAHLLMKN